MSEVAAAARRRVPGARVYYGRFSSLVEPGLRRDFAWRCTCGWFGLGFRTRTTARIGAEQHRASMHPRWPRGSVRPVGT